MPAVVIAPVDAFIANLPAAFPLAIAQLLKVVLVASASVARGVPTAVPVATFSFLVKDVSTTTGTISFTSVTLIVTVLVAEKTCPSLTFTVSV